MEARADSVAYAREPARVLGYFRGQDTTEGGPHCAHAIKGSEQGMVGAGDANPRCKSGELIEAEQSRGQRPAGSPRANVSLTLAIRPAPKAVSLNRRSTSTVFPDDFPE